MPHRYTVGKLAERWCRKRYGGVLCWDQIGVEARRELGMKSLPCRTPTVIEKANRKITKQNHPAGALQHTLIKRHYYRRVSSREVHNMSARVSAVPQTAPHAQTHESSHGSLATPGTSPASIRKQLAEASLLTIHTLKPGETIWSIAQKAGLDYKAILKLNRLDEKSACTLADGTKIKLPATPASRSSRSPDQGARTHEVQPGETIYGIAKEHRVPCKRLLEMNGLTERSARNVRDGTKLKLGSSTDTASTLDTDCDFDVTDKTRDQIGRRSKPGARLVSLDFNDARSSQAKGIEVVIPDNATHEERRAADAYVKGVQAFFKSHGVERPIRGVHTRSETGRGVPGIIHTEPFFLKDKAALRAIQADPAGYVKVLSETLGTIEGVTFMPPHKINDPGAQQGSLNERDFAKKVLIPLLKKRALA